MFRNIYLVVALLLAFTLGLGTQARAQNDTDLLPEDEAFAFTAELLPDNQLAVRWRIADGYYMYRDKMHFEVMENGIVDPVTLPPGKPKDDVLFGNVEVYTGEVSMVLPILKDVAEFTLLADGQGCNEPVGVCYPPIRHQIKFSPANNVNLTSGTSQGSNTADPILPGQPKDLLGGLLAQPEESPSTKLSSSNDISDTNTVSTTPSKAKQETKQPDPDKIKQLQELLSTGFEQPEYLAVEDAFKLSLTPKDSQTVLAHFVVADGYYLYRDKVKFTSAGSAQVGDFILPKGQIKEDQYIGPTKVLRAAFDVPINLIRTDPESGEMTLQTVYQGCADEGICYPPVTSEKKLTLPALINIARAESVETVALPLPVAISTAVESVDNRPLSALLLGAFIAGLLLTFTPCVLPMIPILSGIIAGQGSQLNKRRGGILAIVYVLGTAVTYAAMGGLAGATGEQLQAYFQNPWAIGVLAFIFVLMACAMFGMYEFQMPSAIQSRLQSGTGNMKGSIPLVFILGLVSALIVGACVSPVLISFLGIAVSKADPVLGAQTMFVMALGMGIPLIALGFGAGYLIPKAGAWMESVKHFFGVMLIAVAIYILGVLPAVPILLLWGVFLIIISSYLGATQALPSANSGLQRLAKGIGVVLLVWGIAALIGGFYGQRDLIRPLPETLFGNNSQIPISSNHTTLFTRINNSTELSSEMERARSLGKSVMIDFYADWCIDCIKMEKTTLQDPEIVAILSDQYVSLQVDVTDPNDPGTSAVKKQLGVFGPPAVLFFDPTGAPANDRNFYGYRNAKELLALLIEP